MKKQRAIEQDRKEQDRKEQDRKEQDNKEAEELYREMRPKWLPPPPPGTIEINPFTEEGAQLVIAAMRQYFAAQGRQGGKSKSEVKAAAARANGAKGGRPRSRKKKGKTL
jgi:hypothetical protein